MKKMAIYLSVLMTLVMVSQGMAQAAPGQCAKAAKCNFVPGNKHAK